MSGDIPLHVGSEVKAAIPLGWRASAKSRDERYATRASRAIDTHEDTPSVSARADVPDETPTFDAVIGQIERTPKLEHPSTDTCGT